MMLIWLNCSKVSSLRRVLLTRFRMALRIECLSLTTSPVNMTPTMQLSLYHPTRSVSLQAVSRAATMHSSDRFVFSGSW